MPPRKFHVLPGLTTIPGQPNGVVSIYRPNFWTPASLGSHLLAWWRADLNVTSSGGRVSAWAPALPGIGPTLTQATGASQPLLTAAPNCGLPAVQADSTNVNLQAALASLELTDTQALSIVMSVQVNNGGRSGKPTLALGDAQGFNGLNLFVSNSGCGFSGAGLSLGQYNFASSMTAGSNTALATGAIAQIGYTLDGSHTTAGVDIYVNGSSQSVTSVNNGYSAGAQNSTLSGGNIYLGDTNSYADGQDYVMELFIANRVMTSAEMTNAYQYFTQQI